MKWTLALSLACCLFACRLTAQQTPVPAKVSASYQKYPNRIELSWQATGPDHRYIVRRRERAQAAFSAIDTVAQNRYIDRNKLRYNTDYVYAIQSVTTGGQTSPLSREAIGALLNVANQHAAPVDSLVADSACLSLRLTDLKSTGQIWALRFGAQSRCRNTATAQLSLYWSANAALDSADLLLKRQDFPLTRTRGAITAAKPATNTPGFLLLKVDMAGSQPMLLVRRAE